MSSNLWNLLAPAFDAHANHTAWICRGDNRRIITYRALQRAALAVACDLRARGVGAGDCVGILAPNLPEWGAAALAAWKVGACIAPLPLGSSEEIARQLDALRPKVVLAHDAPQIADAMPIDWRDDSDAVARETEMQTLAEADACAVKLYTSGSIARPKVAHLSHANFASNVLAIGRIQQFDQGDRFIALLPFSHAMGITGTFLLPLANGAGVVSPRVLAAAEVLAALGEEKVTALIAVPRLYRNIMLRMEKTFAASGPALRAYLFVLRRAPLALRRVLNAPLRKKFGGRIKAWISGGSHLDADITRYFHALGLPLRQGYGLTETSPLVSLQEKFDAAPESVGKPIDRVRVKLHAPDADGVGEVWIAGPNVMLGYADAEQNRAAMQEEWFKSGDLARLDAAGRIHLCGRLKRLIVTDAGKNVWPEILETDLERDARVKEAAVIEKDKKPAALLALDDDIGNAQDAARDVVREYNARVSTYHRITRFVVVSELPRTRVGKIALGELAQLFDEMDARAR